MVIKRLVSSLFPHFYRAIALAKRELWDEYCQLHDNSRNCTSVLGGVKYYSLATYAASYLFHGATPFEYTVLGFAKLNRKAKKEFITMRRNRWLDGKFNDAKSNKILWDKGLFNNYFSEFIHRKYLYIDDSTNDAEILQFHSSLKNGRYIVKPNDLFYGQGISTGDSYKELIAIRNQGKPTIVEELMVNDPELSVLNESSLNTFRVVTCIDRIGQVHILAILLRTGRAGAVIDNMLGGGTCYHVDIDTGVVDGLGRDALGNNYLKHPTSGVIMPGFRVSRIEEIRDFAVRVAKSLPNARYVGWDIALTTKGIELIEGNVTPSAELIQCNKIGLYPTIKALL